MASYWNPVTYGENSPFVLEAVHYYAEEQHRGTGFAVFVHAPGLGLHDKRILTRETPNRDHAERVLAAYDRDYETYNAEAIIERYGKVMEGGVLSGQITAREDRFMAGIIVSDEDREHRWRSGEARAISRDLDRRFNHTASSSRHWNLYGSSFVDVNRDAIWRTVDIVPDGESPVSAPTYQLWYDGNHETCTYEDFDGAVLGAFYHYSWPGGGNVSWLDEHTGEAMCGQCAAEHWLETGVSLTPQAEENEYGYGVYCDNDPKHCIAESRCVECMTANDEVYARGEQTFIADDGASPHYLCESCIEKLVEAETLALGEADTWNWAIGTGRKEEAYVVIATGSEWYLDGVTHYTNMRVDTSYFTETE